MSSGVSILMFCDHLLVALLLNMIKLHSFIVFLILFIKLILLDLGIRWIVFDNGHSSQQDLPQIRLYDCTFDGDIVFFLSGLISLIRCEFKGDYDVYLNIEKSQNEPEITEETLRKFSFNKYPNRIEFIQTKIDVRYLQIYVKSNVARHLKMENIDLGVHYYLDIYIGEEGHDFQTVSVFELDVINCRMSASMKFYLRLPNSFAKFWFGNTVFEKISFDSVHYAGLASYVFDNCTFIKALYFDIQRFLDFNILGSSIIVPYDCEGRECDVRLTGIDNDNLMSDGTLSNMVFNQSKEYSLVDIESSTFQGGYGPFFTIDQADMKFSKTVFHIRSHRTRVEILIDFKSVSVHSIFEFITEDVLINLTSTDRELQQVNIMSIVTRNMHILKTQILCPLGMDAVETVPLNSNEPHVYHCEAACTSDMYTFQSGNMTLHGYYALWSSTSLLNTLVNPHCNQCPVGAKCSGNIKPLPNYWGYRNMDEVAMIRCPPDYCCQDEESCQCLDSCNRNRTGHLCGACEKGFAESLFDATCIPVEKCHKWLIVLLYIGCAVAYGLGLMVIDNIKEALISCLKKIYECIEEKLLKNIKPNQNLEKAKNSEKSEGSEKEIKEEGSFKYLQILFYYVQDAALFKIELPGKQSEQTNTFVKILQFTPDVLTSVYNSVTETCFDFGTTAVSKIIFKSIFGPCVVLFLFTMYLFQRCIFSLRNKKSKLSSLIKYKLVQSFILVILLSYQQIVTGAFTLVKCIDIGNINSLYVQGNIQCFTQWQIAIEIFIWANIFPSFLFSHMFLTMWK